MQSVLCPKLWWVTLLNKGIKHRYRMKCLRHSIRSICKCSLLIHASYDKQKRAHTKGFFYVGFWNPSQKKNPYSWWKPIFDDESFQFHVKLNTAVFWSKVKCKKLLQKRCIQSSVKENSLCITNHSTKFIIIGIIVSILNHLMLEMFCCWIKYLITFILFKD